MTMIISSIGIGIGLAVTELTSAASETTAVLQGLAAGTLVYVVMFEVTLGGFTSLLLHVPPVLLWPYLNPSYKMATCQ